MPTAYLSAQFSDTQFKWSTVVKEGYANCYAIKKWSHYLEDAEILLKSPCKITPEISTWEDRQS